MSRPSTTSPTFVHERLRDVAHLGDDVAGVGGHGGLGEAQPGDLGDVQGEVAHALEVGDHVQRRDRAMRRSVATGCCRAIIWKARSSRSTRRASTWMSAAMTRSARARSASSSGPVACSIGDGDQPDHLGDAGTDLVELVVEHVTHGLHPPRVGD